MCKRIYTPLWKIARAREDVLLGTIMYVLYVRTRGLDSSAAPAPCSRFERATSACCKRPSLGLLGRSSRQAVRPTHLAIGTMPIMYMDPVANLGKDYVLPLSWVRIFLYWHGSLLQRLLFEVCILFGLAAFIIAMKLYVAEWPRFLLEVFANIVNILSGVLTLLLGFYASTIYSRWWYTRTNMFGTAQGGVYNCGFMLNALVYDDENPELCARFKQRFLRWMNLAFGIMLMDVTSGGSHLFESFDSMERIGLVTPEERYRLEHDVERVRFTLPIMWAGHMLTRLRDNNHQFHITDRVHMQLSIELAYLRQGLGGCYLMKNTPVPLLYVQFVEVAVRMYVISMILLVGDLNLLSGTFQERGNDRWVDLVYIAALFFIYVGWLHVAEELANPFRIAPDGLDLDDLLSGQRCDVMTMSDSTRQRLPKPEVIQEAPLPGEQGWYLPIITRDHSYEPVPYWYSFWYNLIRRRKCSTAPSPHSIIWGFYPEKQPLLTEPEKKHAASNPSAWSNVVHVHPGASQHWNVSHRNDGPAPMASHCPSGLVSSGFGGLGVDSSSADGGGSVL